LAKRGADRSPKPTYEQIFLFSLRLFGDNIGGDAGMMAIARALEINTTLISYE